MLQTLTLDQMRVFVAVAESGSFHAAARRIGRVQSAVSHAIANLEAEVGVTLFDRAGRRPALTREARALLEDVRAILLSVDCLKARARGFNEGVEVTLRLVADPLYPTPRLASALGRMRDRFSSVKVDLSIESLGGPVASLVAGSVDLAISVGDEFQASNVELEALASIEMHAVAAANHPLARRTDPVSLTDLSGHLQIVQVDPSTYTEGRDIGVLSPETWRVHTLPAKHALISAGVGWGRLPSWAIEADLAAGRLARLDARALGRDGTSLLAAYLAWRTDRAMGPAARALRDLLR